MRSSAIHPNKEIRLDVTCKINMSFLLFGIFLVLSLGEGSEGGLLERLERFEEDVECRLRALEERSGVGEEGKNYERQWLVVSLLTTRQATNEYCFSSITSVKHGGNLIPHTFYLQPQKILLFYWYLQLSLA